MQASRLVLVVEDEPDNQEIMRAVVEDLLGYDALLAYNGQAALEAVSHRVPDLILMDLMLPVMSGIDASRQIKADAADSIATIPIVAMSAGVNLRAAAGELPVDGVLAKPFDIDELLATVSVHVRQNGLVE